MGNMRELDLNEMEQVSGGREYGMTKPPLSKDGCMAERVRDGDTILSIAHRFGLHYQKILDANPGMTRTDTLIPNTYIYIPTR